MTLRRLVLFAFAVLTTTTTSCTTWHECSAHDRQRFVESSLDPSRIPPHAKALAHRVVSTGEGERVEDVGMYTHASQYKSAGGVTVDFAREEVVRVIASGPKNVLWVAETDVDVVIGVLVEPRPCTAFPSPDPPTAPVDMVIALTTKPVRIVRHDPHPACDLHGAP